MPLQAAAVFPSPADDPFTQPLSEVQSAVNINYYSAYVAAQEAVKSFKALSSNVKKTFIFTGNALNVAPIPGLLAFGAAKTASAHMIANAARVYPGSAGYRYVRSSLSFLFLYLAFFRICNRWCDDVLSS